MRALYKNGTASRISHTQGGTYEPGESKTESYFYRRLEGLTLVTTDDQAPWVTLFSGAISTFSDPLTGLSEYKQIVVTNDSGAVLDVTANGDTSNLLHIPDGVVRPIDQKTEPNLAVNTLDIAGDGTGDVHIEGWR